MRPDQGARDRVLTDLDASFAVDAGAGTGKTTLLVGRLAALVAERGVSLKRIAAITFTDKAAGELVARLRKELEDRLARDPAHAPRLLHALRDLEQASVSTLHAFCQSILREYPIEAGVDPRFKVLDRVQSEAFENQAWEGWLKQSLAERVESLDWFDALDGTFLQVLELKKFLLANRSLLGGVEEPTLPDPKDLLRVLAQGVEGLAARGSFCRDKGDLLWAQILEFRRDWKKLLQLPSEDQRFAIPGLAIPKPKSGSQAKWDKAVLAEAREEILRLHEARDEYSSRLRDAALRAVQRWLGGYLTHYAKRKTLAGFLDFDDLLSLARDLLKDHPEVREELKGRYDRIFVDEFQDTDPLQVEIIFLLAEKSGGKAKGWREAKLTPGKLFLVGDPKQSIYRFRRADVEIYEEAKAKLSDDGGLVENLTENFRTQAPIVEWVNRRFEGLMGAFGLPYVAQHAARADESLPSDALPPLGLLPLPPAGDKEPVGVSRKREAEAVADHLRDLLSGGKATVMDPATKQRRQVKAGDVAILFRALSNSEEAYEDALRSRGIPFQVVGGKRFYHRSEIAALESLLRCLASPADENACVALLRSPIFGFTDEELLLHRSRGGVFSYLRSASGRMGKAFATLREWHGPLRGLSPSEALGYLYEHSSILPVTASQPHGEQRVANLLKVLDQARALEASENFTLRGFVRWLGEQRDGETLEGEAPGAGDQGDRVTLMTLHKAKGLEFPLVILSAITSEGGHPKSALLDRAKGRCEIKLGAKDLGLRTLGYEALEAKEDQQDQAETLRLLYVGCTRARDALVVPLRPGGFLEPLDFSETDKRFVLLKPLEPAEAEDPPALVVNLDEKEKNAPVVETSSAQWKEAQRRRTEKTQRLLSLGAPTLRAVTSLLKVEPDKMFREGASLEGQGDPEEIVPVDRGSAQSLGTLTHLLMEKGWGWEPDLIRKAAKAWGPDQGLRGEKWEERAAEAAGWVIRAFTSPVLKRAAMSPRRCAEVPVFDSTRPEGPLFGILDLAFLEDGQWVLVDYKTDRDPDKLTAKYQEQLNLYAGLLKSATGIPVKEACLLFLRTGESRNVPLTSIPLDAPSSPGTFGPG